MTRILFALALPALLLFVWPAIAVAQGKAEPPAAKIGPGQRAAPPPAKFDGDRDHGKYEWKTEGVYMPTLTRDGKVVGYWSEYRNEFWTFNKSGNLVVGAIPADAPKFPRDRQPVVDPRHHGYHADPPPVTIPPPAQVGDDCGGAAASYGGGERGGFFEARPLRALFGRLRGRVRGCG